jgi:Flp pilus assembly protein TadG
LNYMKNKFALLSLFSKLLGKDRLANGSRSLARLLRDEQGSYVLMVTLAIPAFIGFAGFATEGALIFYNLRSTKSAADAAAYSAAISYSIDGSASNAQTQAQAIVADYGFVLGQANGQANVVATVDTTTYSPLTAINVSVTRPQLPILSSIWVNNPFNVNGSATAIISGGTLTGGGSGGCILSLASTGTGIQLGGTSFIQDSSGTCGVFSNSGISLNGNTSIIAGSVGAAGTVTGGGNIGPPPESYTQNDTPISNPYASITTSAPGTCINDTQIKNASSTVTLNPGTYCSTSFSNSPALEIKNSSVTLSAGTYIFVGQLKVETTSNVTGTGVTLMFTDPSGAAYPNGQGTGNIPTALDISSQANVNLTAPTSGATQGLLIIGNTNIPTSTAFNLQAGGTATSCTATNCIGGLIYVPTGAFTWQGGPILSGGCTQMIAYTMALQGNAQFNNSACNVSSGGGGGGPLKPIGNIVTLVK